METDISPYITLGIWLSGAVFFLLIFLGILRFLYQVFIVPFRRYGKLTLEDLRNRRKFATNRETFPMKLFEIAIWCSGSVFTGIMLLGIGMSIYFNFHHNKPFKQILLQMLSIDNVTRLVKGEMTLDMKRAHPIFVPTSGADTAHEDRPMQHQYKTETEQRTAGGHAIRPLGQTIQEACDFLDKNILPAYHKKPQAEPALNLEENGAGDSPKKKRKKKRKPRKTEE